MGKPLKRTGTAISPPPPAIAFTNPATREATVTVANPMVLEPPSREPATKVLVVEAAVALLVNVILNSLSTERTLVPAGKLAFVMVMPGWKPSVEAPVTTAELATEVNVAAEVGLVVALL